jgi:hypothetical protein
MKQNVENMEKLLESVGKSQKQVVKGIDDLLKEAQKMKGQSGSSSCPFGPTGEGQKPKDQQANGQPREQRNRQPRQLQKPGDMAQQPKKSESGKERNDQPETEKGKKVAGTKRPDDATEKVNGKKVQGAWGELPDYLLKSGRGSMPDVPERYRKYLEALTRENQGAGNK